MSEMKGKNDSPAAKAILTIVSLLGCLALAFALYETATKPISPAWIVIGLVITAAMFRLDAGLPVAPSAFRVKDLLLFASVLLYGPGPAAVLAGLDAAASTSRRELHSSAFLFRVALQGLLVFSSGSIATGAFGSLGYQVTASSSPDLLLDLAWLAPICFVMAVLYYGLKSAAECALEALGEGREFKARFQQSFIAGESLLKSLASYSAIALAIAGVKIAAEHSFAAFIIASLLAASAYLARRAHFEQINSSNNHHQQMSDLHLRTIEALAIAVDAKDEVTHDHVFRVQIYATGLARLFGLSDVEIEALKAGALLHDIGKLAVPDYILNKPGKLTPAEFEEMKLHTVIGAEILEHVKFPYPVVPIVRHHHERWDGRGYPDGLKGEQIPMTARIISVVDCFDAVREDRQYRKAMTRAQAIELIRNSSGTMYDPKVVETFIEHLPEFEEEIRLHKMQAQSSGKREKGIINRPLPQATEREVFDHIRQAHVSIDALYNIVEMIGDRLNLRDALTLMTDRLQDFVPYTTCALYLVRQDTTDVEAVHSAGRNAESLRGRRMTSGAGISGWVVATGHAMHNSDPRLDFDALKIEASERYKTATVAPLLRNGRVIGALAVYSAEIPVYQVEHLRMVEAVAKLTSDALAKVAKTESRQTSELTDKVTELPNVAALKRRFEIESDRASRHGESFTLMMFDIDNFKQLNQAMGRQDADHLLWEVARLLAGLFRTSDFLCRYTADRFVALIQAEPEEAREMMQRIQKVVDKHDFGFATSSIFVGMSAGAASYGNERRTLDEMLVEATRAMTADKVSRNGMASGAGYIKTSSVTQYKVM
jgi:diguanylate cyclase (GGDEF)-like protein/putative nucleotidyltransferase with HDIG domain